MFSFDYWCFVGWVGTFMSFGFDFICYLMALWFGCVLFCCLSWDLAYWLISGFVCFWMLCFLGFSMNFWVFMWVYYGCVICLDMIVVC